LACYAHSFSNSSDYFLLGRKFNIRRRKENRKEYQNRGYSSEKAKEGVEVKFIIDGVGSLLLSRRYIKDLEKNGARVEFFFPLLSSILQGTLNFRNHRKIIVIDREIGFIGGINIGDEYLGQGNINLRIGGIQTLKWNMKLWNI
jgi:hypothetical protein